MRGPKRSKSQRLKDLEIIARRTLEGGTQVAIAAEIGISRQQVGFDLKVIFENWKQSSLLDFDLAKAKELARLNNLEATHWRGWERSLQDFRSKSVKTGGKDGPETTRKREQRVGDPRFLEGVGRCIEQRCKLLGINAPAKIQPVGADGSACGFGVLVVPGVASPDDWTQRAAAQQAELLQQSNESEPAQ